MPGVVMPGVVILVAIGSNLPDPDAGLLTPLAVCRAAAVALRTLPGLRMQAESRWYRSAPVPRSDQPDYVNGVVKLVVSDPAAAAPEALLAALQQIELRFGRRRGLPNAARTLDLDMIAMGETGSLLREAPDPILPHPRAAIRAFVLLPLRDVAPDWIDPRSGRGIDALIAALPAEDRASTLAIDHGASVA